jgi:FtsP/CotA-like multicopper oxidase with cupredoxin domain
MRHALIAAVFAATAALLVDCGPDRDSTVERPASAGARRFDLSGNVKKVTLEISEFDWEVGPGAIYRAIGYDRRIPGPVIEATAGDVIELTLVNKTGEPHSAHTHVVKFDPASDGVMMGVAPPGGSVTVRWEAVYAGTFPYHDHAGHAGESEGVTAGLIGALIVHAPDEPQAVENVVLLSDLDVARFVSLPGVSVGDAAPGDGAYRGGHQYLHAINGRAYQEWAPRFEAKVGDRVRWRVISIGREFHTFHVHGHAWVGADGVLTDNINLGPGTYSTFEWIEDRPGEWLYHCHVPDHMEGGMVGVYAVGR